MFKRIIIALILFLSLLALASSGNAFQYCKERYFDNAKAVQEEINELVQKLDNLNYLARTGRINRDEARREGNEIKDEIEMLKRRRDCWERLNMECETRFKEYCGYPKWKQWGSVSNCETMFIRSFENLGFVERGCD